jgi:hypothetical protein
MLHDTMLTEESELREALPLSLLRSGPTSKQKKKKPLAAHRGRAIKSLKNMLRTLADVDDDVWQDALQQRMTTRLEHLKAKHGQLCACSSKLGSVSEIAAVCMC